ncbi:hypothetical protein KC960_04305, partial [Candidatus Saccharibacteria bacterium]|nr:hypothetical protein [Candidatus Saccharibacteria bacterium]
LGSLAGIGGGVWIFKEFLGEAISNIAKSILGSQKAEAKSLEVMTYQERLNSPEQFEEKFNEMLSYVEGKLVVVFDNIDRVQGKTAISMLSTIKNFMYAGASKLIFIVPCDFEAIESQVAKYFDKKSKSTMPPGEYLRKIFNLTLWVPEFVNTDLEEYTKSCLNMTGTISEILNTEEVVLVITSAFSNNPREIIQFVNNLVAAVMVAHNSDVKTEIDKNIAYLAKVQAIRQLYPDQYKKLKKYWYKPEAVLEEADAGNDKQFIKFLNDTNRVTVDDAEPYIYLKDPVTSRNIKNAKAIKTALVNGDNETAATEAGKVQNKQQLVTFMSDLLLRYWGQTEVLMNVLRTHFHILATTETTVSSKRYFDNLFRTIDSQLWSEYPRLPHNEIFVTLNNPKLQKDLKRQIVDRYVATITGLDESVDRDLLIYILNKFKDNPNLLSAKNTSNIRQFIEEKFSEDNEILTSFNTFEDQDKFITVNTIEKYINGINDDNIETRINNLSSYKKFVMEKELLQQITQKVSERFKNANAANADFTDLKEKMLSAIKILITIFRENLKEPPEPIKEIGLGLNQAFNGASNWENKAKTIITHWWIRPFLPSPEKETINKNILDYIGSAPTEGRKVVIDYWNEDTTKRLIAYCLDVLLPQMLREKDFLEYIYKKSSTASKKLTLEYLITNTSAGRYTDIEFINMLDSVPDREALLKQLLNKAETLRYDYREPYYNYIATNMKKNDDREIKDQSVEQIKKLLQTNTAAESVVGYDFFSEASALSISDKRHIAIESLEWLRSPGTSLTIENRHTINVVADCFSELQETPKHDFVFLIMNMISENSSDQINEMAFKVLERLQIPYGAYIKDFDDLLSRVQKLSDRNRQRTIAQRLLNLTTSWKGRNAKSFIKSINESLEDSDGEQT